MRIGAGAWLVAVDGRRSAVVIESRRLWSRAALGLQIAITPGWFSPSIVRGFFMAAHRAGRNRERRLPASVGTVRGGGTGRDQGRVGVAFRERPRGPARGGHGAASRSGAPG